MNHLQLYLWLSGCSNMELFRELFSIHTGAPFTTTRFLSLTCMLHVLYMHTQTSSTQHLLGSLTLANPTDVTQMLGWHLRVQRGQRKNKLSWCAFDVMEYFCWSINGSCYWKIHFNSIIWLCLAWNRMWRSLETHLKRNSTIVFVITCHLLINN